MMSEMAGPLTMHSYKHRCAFDSGHIIVHLRQNGGVWLAAHPTPSLSLHRLHTKVPERAGLNGQRSPFHGLGGPLKLFIDDPVGGV